MKRNEVPIPAAPLVVPSSCKEGGQHWVEHGGECEAIEDVGIGSRNVLLKGNVGERR